MADLRLVEPSTTEPRWGWLRKLLPAPDDALTFGGFVIALTGIALFSVRVAVIIGGVAMTAMGILTSWLARPAQTSADSDLPTIARKDRLPMP